MVRPAKHGEVKVESDRGRGQVVRKGVKSSGSGEKVNGPQLGAEKRKAEDESAHGGGRAGEKEGCSARRSLEGERVGTW